MNAIADDLDVSVRADFAGSIAGLDSAFHTLAADDEEGTCANPQAARSDARTIDKKAWRIIRVSPGVRPESTSS